MMDGKRDNLRFGGFCYNRVCLPCFLARHFVSSRLYFRGYRTGYTRLGHKGEGFRGIYGFTNTPYATPHSLYACLRIM